MNILVGTTTLNVTNCYAYRYQNGKLVLKIDVPQTEIAHDDLKNLIKTNTADIVLTYDDGSTETFSGFSYTLTILDKDETYYVEVECISETERKVASMQRDISSQNDTIEELNDTLLEVLLG